MQGNKKQQQFIIFTPEYAKDLPGLNVYAIYPDYWGESIKYKGVHNWGPAPCLGYVKEQSYYWAKVAALVAGIVPANATFGAKPVLIKTRTPYFQHKRKYKNGNSSGNKVQ